MSDRQDSEPNLPLYVQALGLPISVKQGESYPLRITTPSGETIYYRAILIGSRLYTIEGSTPKN